MSKPIYIHDIEQGSAEWHACRMGIPTASEFSKIITPTGRASTQAEKYQAKLLAEWALGWREDDGLDDNYWIERGKALEPDARKYYAFFTDCEPQKVAFVYRDDSRMIGASPDSLVGEHGLLEIKCPAPHTHIGYLAKGILPSVYRMQIQGQMWITGRKWADFLSYYPDLPPFLYRVEPDAKIFAAFESFIANKFIDDLLAGRKRLEELGVKPD